MSTPAVVWLTIGLVSLAALIAMLVGLLRHLLVLSRSLGKFQEEIQPLADAIATEGQRASDRTSRWSGGARSDRPRG